MKCPTCGADNYEPKPSSNYLAVPEGWKETVDLIRLRIPKENAWEKTFMADMSGKTQVSEKQWKSFAGIYRDVFGKYPAGDWPNISFGPKIELSPSPVVTLTDEELANTF